MRADFSNPDINKYTQAIPSAPLKKADMPAEPAANAIEQKPPAAQGLQPPKNTIEISDNKTYDFQQEVTFSQSPISTHTIESVQRVESLTETPDLPNLDDLATAIDFWQASALAFEEGADDIGNSLWEVAKEFDPGVPDPRLP